MTKFCPECGAKQHDDNNRYCSNCGFDFSKLEDMMGSDRDDCINVPISSNEDSVDSKIVSDRKSADSGLADSGSKTSSDSAKPKISPKSANKPINQSFYQGTKSNYNSTERTKNKNSLGFLSNLTFNKCFFAFAALLILLLIIGMVGNATQEPYSDGGLTSFMESSNNYGLNDFLEDESYDDDYSDDYLMYGDDRESSRSKGSLI